MSTASTLPAPTLIPAPQPPAIGQSFPLGATCTGQGVNFSLFSRTASGVDLLLFDSADATEPTRTIPFDPVLNHSYHYWHAFVPGLRAGQIYGYRVYGPDEPAQGLRFNPDKILLDPYGRGIVYADDTPDGKAPGTLAMKSVVVDPAGYDWEDDRPLHLPSSRTIVYEMHVGGFTRHPSSGLDGQTRGTYAGLIEKIPYLQKLGVTAVELLPVFAFDPYACPTGLVNYWGYQPVSFFSPHPCYSSNQDPLGPVNEFRDMVKALHRAGIEVILDVVFNHTAEGNENGNTVCFRGIDNPTYYILDEDRSRYSDFTGCGNTLNANHPVVRRMIVDSLKHWVREMHVDGFRFDLASILARDSQGHVLPNPPVLWDIESEPELASIKLIAEAWDAAGLYQVGSFVGDAWKEWNGRFRDDVRDFFRGAPGSVGKFADRFIGSHEVYGHKQREAEQSINFVDCHDGFTLNDLVTYNGKHNEANGENNRDGGDDNRSWNCGVEGPTSDPDIESLRNRQVKNFLTVTSLSIGIPMILMGDEVRRTQDGNNNAYCHDSEFNWFDWSLVEEHADVLRFTQLLFARRLLRDAEHERRRVSLTRLIAQSNHAWHGVKLHQPDWGDQSHCLAFLVELKQEKLLVYFIFNAYREPLDFELPPTDNGWRCWIDTSLASPDDIVEWQQAPPVAGNAYPAAAHSVAVLCARLDGNSGTDNHNP